MELVSAAKFFGLMVVAQYAAGLTMSYCTVSEHMAVDCDSWDIPLHISALLQAVASILGMTFTYTYVKSIFHTPLNSVENLTTLAIGAWLVVKLKVILSVVLYVGLFVGAIMLNPDAETIRGMADAVSGAWGRT